MWVLLQSKFANGDQTSALNIYFRGSSSLYIMRSSANGVYYSRTVLSWDWDNLLLYEYALNCIGSTRYLPCNWKDRLGFSRCSCSDSAFSRLRPAAITDKTGWCSLRRYATLSLCTSSNTLWGFSLLFCLCNLQRYILFYLSSVVPRFWDSLCHMVDHNTTERLLRLRFCSCLSDSLSSALYFACCGIIMSVDRCCELASARS